MGSYSMKCAVTSLPITAGDDIVLLFGTKFKGPKGRDTGGFIYQHHFFNLLTTPIFGKYDDYGWIEECDHISIQVARDVLQLKWGNMGPKGRQHNLSSDFEEGQKVIYNEKSPEESDLKNGSEGFISTGPYKEVFFGGDGKTTTRAAMWTEAVMIFNNKPFLVRKDNLSSTPHIPPAPSLEEIENQRNFHILMKEYIHEDFEPTFIHRAVWNKLVETSRGNFHGDFDTGEYNNSSPEEKARNDPMREILIKHGCKIGQYSPYGYTHQFFDACSELINDTRYCPLNVFEAMKEEGVDTELIEKIKLFVEDRGEFDRKNIPPDQVSFFMRAIRPKNYGHSRTIVSKLASWFHFAVNYENYEAKVDVSYVKGMLNVVNSKDILLQTQLFCNGLIKGGIIVRGSDDMASEQQCGGPLWPHIAIHEAVGNLIRDRKEYFDEEDSAIGLDESYEFN